jgi:hypothetical protein
MKWTGRLAAFQPARMSPEEMFAGAPDGTVPEMSAQFVETFERELVTGLDHFGQSIRGADAYRGIGSLQRTDPLAIRNRPVLRLSDGSVVPLSIGLVADRATALWRFCLPDALKGVRSGMAAMGYPFEAYVSDLLSDHIGPNHTVLTEQQLAAVLGNRVKCDHVVVHGDEWLFIETSLINLNRKIADGSASAVDAICRRYHEEADQAQETANHAAALAAAYNLGKPQSVAILVVTENPLAHTPALMRRLHGMRPDRNPRFVCSVTELEGLIALAAIGWSMPAGVAAWKMQRFDGPLQSAIVGMASIWSSQFLPLMDAAAWVSRLPRKNSSAA